MGGVSLVEQKGWKGWQGECCNVFREKRAFEPNHLFPAQIAAFTRSGWGELSPILGLEVEISVSMKLEREKVNRKK